MAQDTEKRGPVEKTEKGWPINPFGVFALIVFSLVIVFFIAKPLIFQKNGSQNQTLQQNNTGGRIVSPNAGQIIREESLKIEFLADNPSEISKVQFWAKVYADGNWKIIGESTSEPYIYNWQIPSDYQNKAVAITTHLITKDSKEIKDPGGWREGIILLSQ